MPNTYYPVPYDNFFSNQFNINHFIKIVTNKPLLWELLLLDNNTLYALQLQNITSHLIHHIAEDIVSFGPVYGRWAYPYERALCWLARRIKNKNTQESSVMESVQVRPNKIYTMLPLSNEKFFDG